MRTTKINIVFILKTHERSEYIRKLFKNVKWDREDRLQMTNKDLSIKFISEATTTHLRGMQPDIVYIEDSSFQCLELLPLRSYGTQIRSLKRMTY